MSLLTSAARRGAALGTPAVAALALALLTPVSAAADAPAVDGLSEATAAASCWEIAQADPAASSGIYWLLTPDMVAPEQFFCDQETDGGGWVLVGRGRERWSESILGSGTPAQVRDVVTGTAAFTPRQLSGAVIDDLLGDQPVTDLDDGIRLVRAANAAGSEWQDVRFHVTSPRDEWTWQFADDQRVGDFSFDGASGSGGYTSSFGLGSSSTQRVRTITGSAEGWAMGFGYGSGVSGSTAASSYLWSKSTSSGYARPFTQVFLRPKLATPANPTPAEGLPASTGEPVAEAFALRQEWGVAGLGAGPWTIEGSNEVSAFGEEGGRVIVGGNFTTVQRSANGADAAQQSYLAAFDRDSGTWDAGFRPVFDNQVKAVAGLGDGRVAVGGYFSTVNDQPHAGLVVLDAATGAVDESFTGALLNYLSGGVPSVRSMDVQDGWLYVAGSFTHATDGSVQAYTRAAARFDIASGAPDAWNPEFNGTVMSIDASSQGDRVYAAGHFSESRGRTAEKAAALATADETLFPWEPLFSNRAGGRTGYQQAVLEVGDRVWLGGSEHSLMSYDRDSLEVLSSNITMWGGDFQALASDGTSVYAGCHCFEAVYEGATRWPSIGTEWTGVHAIYGSGAWDAATGEYRPSFNGTFNTRAGAGTWALFADSTGTVWQGGDFTRSMRAGYALQWSGGFVRHAPSDATAPTTPTNAHAVLTADGVDVSWDAAADDRGVAAYQVIRDGRIVASTGDLSASLPAAPASAVYAVRASDAAGNVSASTVPAPAEDAPAPDPDPDPEPASPVIVPGGSEWRTLWTLEGAPADWAAPEFDDAAWAAGPAPIGWGTGEIATPLDTSLSPRPLTSYHRHAVDLDEVPAGLELSVRVDDGVLVFVNGTEVLRENLDDGPVGPGTYANTGVSGGYAVANPVAVEVPTDLLVEGANTIAVEVHSNYRSAKTHSFELTAEATS